MVFGRLFVARQGLAFFLDFGLPSAALRSIGARALHEIPLKAAGTMQGETRGPDYYDICKLFLKLFLLVMYKSMSNSCSFLTKSKASFAILFEMEFIIQL